MHPETKFRGGDFDQRGTLERRHLFALARQSIGKEADDIEENSVFGWRAHAGCAFRATQKSLSPARRRRSPGSRGEAADGSAALRSWDPIAAISQSCRGWASASDARRFHGACQRYPDCRGHTGRLRSEGRLGLLRRDGPDSPFTTALVKYLAEPGLDIRRALGKVRDEVQRETGNRQEPYVYGSLGGEDVALVPAKPTAAAAMAVPPSGEDVALVPAKPAAAAAMTVPPTSVDLDEAVDYRLAERVGSLEGWRAFLAAHPSGFFAQLARAQIEKMLPAGTASASAPARAAYVGGPSNTQPVAGGTGLPASAESATAAAALTPSGGWSPRASRPAPRFRGWLNATALTPICCSPGGGRRRGAPRAAGWKR